MKNTKFSKKTDDEAADVFYCTECGCELISTNKYKLCDNCRRKKASKIKSMLKFGGSVITTIGMIVFKAKNRDVK